MSRLFTRVLSAAVFGGTLGEVARSAGVPAAFRLVVSTNASRSPVANSCVCAVVPVGGTVDGACPVAYSRF